jgi:hypothetical protein
VQSALGPTRRPGFELVENTKEDNPREKSHPRPWCGYQGGENSGNFIDTDDLWIFLVEPRCHSIGSPNPKQRYNDCDGRNHPFSKGSDKQV